VGSKSDAFEAEILKFATYQATTILSTTPASTGPFLALFTTNPTDSGGGTEVSTTSTNYTRIDTHGKWGAPTGTTQVATNAPITFGTASADWGVVSGFALFTLVSGGTMLYWGALGASKTVSNGDTASVASGGLILTED
jgi:hypothetical protein